MSVLSRLKREPLVHFLLIGVVVFAAYALFADEEESVTQDQIVVTDGRIQQLAQIFAKTWQRPPTPQELRGLLDAYVKEEVYYREAVKLGLDRDDTLIRRRMQQKMEFLSEPGEDALAVDDAALQDYLDANKDAYRVEPEIAFEQVFVSTKPSVEEAAARANELLQALKGGEAPDAVGDATLLPKNMTLSPLRIVERNFGEVFAEEAATAELDQWTGPIRSPYGLHLVRVTQREEGYDPKLEDVREAVLRDWREKKRRQYQAEAYGKLRERYDVVFPEDNDSEAEQGDAP